MALAAPGPAGEGVEDGMEAPKPKEAPPDASASSCSSPPHLLEPMAAPGVLQEHSLVQPDAGGQAHLQNQGAAP